MTETTPGLKRKARTPKALQKRKLTVAKAVDQWAECTLAMEGLKVLRDEAAEVLIEYGKRTGRRTFKDRIAMTSTGGGVILDQPKVKKFLGDRLKDFQTRTKLGWSLKLLR